MKNVSQKPRYIAASVQDLALANQKMAFISGPRQVGKTTCAKQIAMQLTDSQTLYRNWDEKEFRRNWDEKEFRRNWAKNPSLAVKPDHSEGRLVILDEIHKGKLWKRDLKGVFDVHGESLKIIVAGSARLNVFQKGGDSLLGRYIPFRLHPFSLAEITRVDESIPPSETFANMFKASKVSKGHRDIYERLFKYGGFPDPYTRASPSYLNIWHKERLEKIVREDLRDLSRIPDLSRLEMLTALLPERAGGLFSLARLREDLEVAHNTLKNWLQYLEQLYYFFTIKPYSKNLKRSLRKEPKLFLWDWSEIEDLGARFENLVASALLKSTDYWTDVGFGHYELRFLRDKEQNEVDFLVTIKGKPIITIEAKYTDSNLNMSFVPFCKKLGINQHIQVIHEPNHWKIDSIEGIKVLRASADRVLQHLV